MTRPTDPAPRSAPEGSGETGLRCTYCGADAADCECDRPNYAPAPHSSPVAGDGEEEKRAALAWAIDEAREQARGWRRRAANVREAIEFYRRCHGSVPPLLFRPPDDAETKDGKAAKLEAHEAALSRLAEGAARERELLVKYAAAKAGMTDFRSRLAAAERQVRELRAALERLATCENMAEYEPGYINRELSARILYARAALVLPTGEASRTTNTTQEGA